ncbi:unnamed protein product [Lactuca virosa]|uniref:Uncharacterized protein n=1 Tax=Lactuca virosa TaxID=75947 RepID=A0AAU9MNA8_9ASTR|nr:unnamed protein product [Lactuca virosa]
MQRWSSPISDQSFTLYANKEQIARVLWCFQDVADDFLEYVLIGARMSTSCRFRGTNPKFYVMVEDEFVEENKKGDLSRPMNKQNSAWQNVNNVDVGNLAVVRRLCPRMLARGSYRMVNQHVEVIDMLDDGNMEKSVTPDIGVDVNDGGGIRWWFLSY